MDLLRVRRSTDVTRPAPHTRYPTGSRPCGVLRNDHRRTRPRATGRTPDLRAGRPRAAGARLSGSWVRTPTAGGGAVTGRSRPADARPDRSEVTADMAARRARDNQGAGCMANSEASLDRGEPTSQHPCVVCGDPVEEVGASCSVRCTLQAEQEVRRNAVELRRASSRRWPPERRRTLVERNGYLSSALLRWRPDDPHRTG